MRIITLELPRTMKVGFICVVSNGYWLYNVIHHVITVPIARIHIVYYVLYTLLYKVRYNWLLVLDSPLCIHCARAHCGQCCAHDKTLCLNVSVITAYFDCA